MRKTSSTYENGDGKALTIEVDDNTLTISIDGVTQWTVKASEMNRSVGERQAQAISAELSDWAREAGANRLAMFGGAQNSPVQPWAVKADAPWVRAETP